MKATETKDHFDTDTNDKARAEEALEGQGISDTADKVRATRSMFVSEGRGRWEQFKTPLRILVGLVQVLAPMGRIFQIPFPSFYAGMLRWFGIIQLEIMEVMPLSCVVTTNLHTTLYVRTLVPLGFISSVGILKLVTHRRRIQGYAKFFLERLLTITFFLVYLIYPGNSQTIFATFPCTEFDDPNQSRGLVADYSIDCRSDAHAVATVFAIIMVVVYPFGVVACYMQLVYRTFGKELTKLRLLEAQRTDLHSQSLSAIRLERFQANDKALVEDDELSVDVVMKMAALRREQQELVQALPDYI